MKLQDHTYDTGTVKLHYVKGPDSGPPLVYLHGGTASWVSVLRFAPYFCLRHTLYAVDFRGHGLSGRVRGHYRVADYAADIHAFIQGCIHHPAVLVGGSLGGIVSAYMGAHHAAAVRAIVLIDAPLKLPPQLPPPFGASIERRHELAAMRKTPAEMREVLRPQTGSERRWALTISQLDPEPVAGFIDGSAWEGWDADVVLAGIDRPTLVLHGDADKGGLVAPDDAEWMRSSIRDCVVDHLEMGHGPGAERGAEAAIIICEFLESLRED